jgi:hypothetical protein
MRFELSPALLSALRAWQATLKYQPDDKVRQCGEAFLLDPGMGPEIFLLADGRVILDERAFFGTEILEASADEAVAAIVVGAEKTGIAALLNVLPPAPPDANDCSRCVGSRWWSVGSNVIGTASKVVCPECHGRGWSARPTAR